MEPKKNPKSDVHKNSRMFFFLSLCISILLVLSAFQWKYPVIKSEVHPPSDVVIYDQIYPVPVTEIKSPSPAPKTIAERPLPNNLVEVESITEIRMELPEEIMEVPPVQIPSAFIHPPIEDDTFIFVQKMPLPKGGYEGFYTFLRNELKYPNPAVRNNTQGKVFVEFVINRKGEPSNVRIIKGIGNGCDEEALRVIALTKWDPGKQRGVPVNVKMTLGVQFKLQ